MGHPVPSFSMQFSFVRPDTCFQSYSFRCRSCTKGIFAPKSDLFCFSSLWICVTRYDDALSLLPLFLSLAVCVSPLSLPWFCHSLSLPLFASFFLYSLPFFLVLSLLSLSHSLHFSFYISFTLSLHLFYPLFIFSSHSLFVSLSLSTSFTFHLHFFSFSLVVFLFLSLSFPLLLSASVSL